MPDTLDQTVLLEVLARVREGDFTARMPIELTGLSGKVADTLNEVIAASQGFVAELARASQVASEVTRVAREVGTEGKLGQAAAVTIEVGGVWRDLTDNVNQMAGNLTGQVRNIAEVTTAVANGDLSKKISIDVKGEFLELKNTVNAMVDQLNAFAGEVTRVAREVGVEGKLGGQAKSREVGGVWKDLTDNVNQLAANLTNQVRAISEVAAAVIEGDLTRQVSVEASGEVAVLKDKLNEMIRNLRETTRQNVEQDWLKTNRERLTRVLQGERDLATATNTILSELAALVTAQHGVFYSMVQPVAGVEPTLEFQAGYGYEERKHLSTSFRLGEGLVGQCAKERKRILLTDVPADYVRINSGLGEATPLNIIVLPVVFEGSVRAVIELASFSAFSPSHLAFLDQITENIGLVLNTIEANTLTENLLAQSRSQAEELRAQNLEAERKNQEVEQSKLEVEEKAGELALSSTYKSEFIANMSHELRTPLNSLLILAEQLESNPDGNMTPTQVEYAAVIRTSGRDLLELLNSILDLAKVESGTVTPTATLVTMADLEAALVREFDHVARAQDLGYSVVIAAGAPDHIVTDLQRLRQILTNLLGNAFKFTEHGQVKVEVAATAGGVTFAVSDTGIGIDLEAQEHIFEPFAQGDGTTARLYGGTGLGLSISRELAGLLGGELTVRSSRPGGSTFTLRLPSAVVTKATLPRVEAVGVSNSFEGVKVLVVDDDFRNIFAMTALLERGSAEVVVAESGADAIAILERTSDIDIVLMDIMMPIMDGYATIQAIRAIERLALLPIVAVTGKVVPGERARCIAAGANDFVPKPVDTAMLLAALQPWLPRTLAAS